MATLRPHFLYRLLVVLFVAEVDRVQSISHAWGVPTKYASAPVYDVEIKHAASSFGEEVRWIDVSYPDRKLGDLNGNHTIIAMYAFDMLSAEQSGQVSLLSGGVNFTEAELRFVPCSGCDLHFQFTVYGLEL